MSELKSTFYNLLLTHANPVENIPEITDFAYLIFIRQPGTKQAAYIVAQANMALGTLALIEAQTNSGSFPDFQLQIRHIKNNNEKLIYSSYVKLILPSNYFQDKSRSIKGSTPTIPVQFILVDPILWDMSSDNSYNFVFNDEKYTALDILQNYINKTIEQRSGSSKKIISRIVADMSAKNNSLYEQIMIPSTITEIRVPEYIIGAYKPFSTPSLWLFDTLGLPVNNEIPPNGELPITGILLNFYNAIDVFPTCDISNDLDVKQFTTLIRTVPYTDTLSVLSKPNAVINFINTAKMTQETQFYGDLPNVTLTDNTKEKKPQRVASIKVEYNDDLEAAERRIVDCVELMQKQINQIEIYETINTSPEWLQFGYLYNMDRDPKSGLNLNRFVHTPLSIFNVFIRQEQKVGRMEHVLKYAMLRLNPKTM